MKIRIIALAILLVLLVATLVAPAAVAEETAAKEETHILSEVIDVFPEGREAEGFVRGGATGHGNNQTRILVHETGIYFTAPLQDFSDSHERYGSHSEAGVWRLKENNDVEMLFRFDIYGIAAGTTSYLMADRDGGIWVASSCQGAAYTLYNYDPATNHVEKYEWTIVSLPKGTKGITAGGKPGAIMDTTFNRIYEFSLGGYGKKTYIVWNVFDLTTKTWSGLFNVETPNPATCYHYGYADGKGGFYATSETDVDLTSLPSGLNDGQNLKAALRAYHSFYHDAGYAWYNSNMLYVPDAMKAEAYNCIVIETPYDVEKGIVPNNYNTNDDLFLDKETGYLYSISSFGELGVCPDKTVLQVFDTNQVNEDVAKDGPFKVICQKDLHFMYGDLYYQHMYKDTTGRIWIIANTGHKGQVEIWLATNNPATEFKLVHIEEFRGFMDAESGKNTYSSIIATERNNSIVSDTAHLIVWKDRPYAHGWVYFNVDFAALRTMLGLN